MRKTHPSMIPTSVPSSIPTSGDIVMMASSASFGAAEESGSVKLSSGTAHRSGSGGSARLRGQSQGQSHRSEHTADGQNTAAGDAPTTDSDSSSSSSSSTTSTASVETNRATAGGVDVTALPALLSQKFEELGHDSVIRPAIITTGSKWEMKSQAQLLGDVKTRYLLSNDQRAEKLQAFELLDALTKSGGLQIKDASLHVIISSAHIFDKSLIHTIIQDNIDPIAKLEQSTLIMASALHGLPVSELVELAQWQRIVENAPQGILANNTSALQ